MTENKKKRRYRLSLSTGGLFLTESLLAVDEYFYYRDWPRTRLAAEQKNIIQSRTASSTKRRVREICQRLAMLTDQQLTLLKNGSRQEQQYLLWLAICKQYLLVFEFATEVIREKFLRMDLNLDHLEFDRFFNAKADWYDELDVLEESTRAKIRQVLFKILHEAEILSDANMIIPVLLTEVFVETVIQDNPDYLRIFPFSPIRA
jgi:hypothetical protein